MISTKYAAIVVAADRLYQITEQIKKQHSAFAGGFRDYMRFAASLFVRTDWLCSTHKEEFKSYLRRIVPDAIAKDLLVPLVLDDFHLERVARELVDELPLSAREVAQIRMIHDSKATVLKRMNVKQVFTFILAAAVLLLKSVPDSVIKWMGIERGDYEFVLFWAASAWFLLLLLIVAIPWIYHVIQQQRHERAEELLVYL
jgi:hypothetical protein